MAGRIVTVARFDQAGQAHVARNALEAAGIKAVIADEAVVSMDWFLSNAVGGIKVQVLEEDAERAVAVLEEALGSDEPVDEETMAAEAEAAGTEEGSEPPLDTPPAPEGAGTEEHGAVEKPSERDEYARRLVPGAFFGLLIPLLWFYAVYLFLNAAFGQGPLSPRGRTKLLVGGLLILLGSFMAYFLVKLYGDPFP